MNNNEIAIKFQRRIDGEFEGEAIRERDIYDAFGANYGEPIPGPDGDGDNARRRRTRLPEGFGKLYHWGYQGEYDFLVLDRLGPSIHALWEYVGLDQAFSLKTTCMIGRQAIKRIRAMHNKGFLHMDIKPENMLMGTGNGGKSRNALYITDFGSSYRHDEWRTWRHRQAHPEQYPLGPNDEDTNANPWVGPSPFIGTDWFASVNVHRQRGMFLLLTTSFCSWADLLLGYTYADDLESLFYSLLLLHTTTLPWVTFSIRDQPSPMQNERMAERKETWSPERICDGLEPEFAIFLTEVRGVPLGQKPNYDRLLKLLDRMWKRHGYSNDNLWDWTVTRYGDLQREAGIII